ATAEELLDQEPVCRVEPGHEPVQGVDDARSSELAHGDYRPVELSKWMTKPTRPVGSSAVPPRWQSTLNERLAVLRSLSSTWQTSNQSEALSGLAVSTMACG